VRRPGRPGAGTTALAPWDAAWDAALFGEHGFYARPEGPAGHFRTASHAAADVLAGAVARLAALAGCDTVLDVGAGRGELLAALARRAAGDDAREADGGQQGNALRLHGVDVVPRPAALPAGAGWTRARLRPGEPVPPGVVDALAGSRGALVLAWELLDTVPCPVVGTGDDGRLHAVLVDPVSGREARGGQPSADDLAWCSRWWPLGEAPGRRAEVGRERDALWAALVRATAAAPAGAVLLAVDYGHVRGERPEDGGLAGYRSGRAVPPVPDGTCDVTAHVAIDAVAAAGEAAGASGTRLVRQRPALQALGVTGRVRLGPPATVPGLVRASLEAELLDPGGLGGFWWLLQAAGRAVPDLRPAPATAG
jgi:SAM-dependent MidA family methyltransferase